MNELATVERPVQSGNGTRLARPDAAIMDAVIGTGDISKLQPEERVQYYNAVCRSMGLNPLTKPFDYITLQGKMTLYATKGCTDQLRDIKHVTVEIVSREFVDQLGLYMVTARATLPDGRHDEDVAALNVKGLSGEALANQIMKTHTKAKRRVTLSVCGLGWLDESEVSSIPESHTGGVNLETGEVADETQYRPQANLRTQTAPQGRLAPPPQARPDAQPAPRPQAQAAADPARCAYCAKSLTPAQATLSSRNYGEPLCPEHQKNRPAPTADAAPVTKAAPVAAAGEADPFADDGDGVDAQQSLMGAPEAVPTAYAEGA